MFSLPTSVHFDDHYLVIKSCQPLILCGGMQGLYQWSETCVISRFGHQKQYVQVPLTNAVFLEPSATLDIKTCTFHDYNQLMSICIITSYHTLTCLSLIMFFFLQKKKKPNKTNKLRGQFEMKFNPSILCQATINFSPSLLLCHLLGTYKLTVWTQARLQYSYLIFFVVLLLCRTIVRSRSAIKPKFSLTIVRSSFQIQSCGSVQAEWQEFNCIEQKPQRARKKKTKQTKNINPERKQFGMNQQ